MIGSKIYTARTVNPNILFLVNENLSEVDPAILAHLFKTLKFIFNMKKSG